MSITAKRKPRRLKVRNMAIAILAVTNILTLAVFLGYKLSRFQIQANANQALEEQKSHVKMKSKAESKRTVESHRQEIYRKSVVRPVMSAKTSEFEDCYRRYLETEPDKAEGQVIVSWLIESNGKVAEPHIAKSDFQSQELTTCLTDKMNSVSFAPPPESQDVMVAHKFSFKRRSPASIEF